MGKINWGRVIVGGLLAGVVLNAFDYVYYGVVMKSDMAAAMQALGKQPQAIDALVRGSSSWTSSTGSDCLWVYAAIRPRFGAGPKTGVIAGSRCGSSSSCCTIWGRGRWAVPQRMYVIGTIVALVQYAVAGRSGPTSIRRCEER